MIIKYILFENWIGRYVVEKNINYCLFEIIWLFIIIDRKIEYFFCFCDYNLNFNMCLDL